MPSESQLQSSSTASPGAAADVPAPPSAGPVVLFQGYDTFANAGRSTAVSGTFASADTSNQCGYTVCETFEKVLKTLNVSCSVSANEYFLDSADLKAQFVNDLQLTTYSVSVVVYCNYIASDERATDYDWKPGFTPPDAGGLLNFYRVYGDQWVNEIVHGAEFMAAYVFYAQSEEEYLAVYGQLSGKYLSEDGSVSATVATQLTNAMTAIQTQQMAKATVIGFTPPASSNMSTDPADMVLFANNFASMAQQQPSVNAVISYGVTGYEQISGFGSVLAKTTLIANRTFFDTTLAGWINDLATLSQKAAAVQNVYNAFAYTADTVFAKNSQQIAVDIDGVQGAIQTLQNNPLLLYDLGSTPASLSVGVPAVSVVWSTQPIWGGHAGPGHNAFNYPITYLLAGYPLTQIVFDGGDVMNFIELTYGNLPPLHCGDTPGGGGSVTLILEPAEFITTIAGMAGDEINQMIVTTTTEGRSVQAPPKPAHAAWFPPWDGKSQPRPVWSVPSGAVLVGFNGSWGGHLTTLQPVCVSFQSATWTPVSQAAAGQ